MEIAAPWLAIIFIVILAGDAIACAIPIDYIRNDLNRLGCSTQVQRAIPLVKGLALVGLVIGLWVPWLGVLACVGMLAYFVVAFDYHRRAADPLANWLPAIGFTALIVAVLLVSYLPGV